MDWVVIRYRDVFVIVALIILIGGGLGGGYYYWRTHQNPQVRAEAAIAKAQQKLESMDSPDAPDPLRQTLTRARAKLETARTEYAAQHYPVALAVATEVLATLKNIEPPPTNVAFLVSQEGSVEVKKAGNQLFTSAKENMLLENGDIVKTSKSGYAKIKYPNGQFQTIAPDSLVVIQALTVSSQGGSKIEVVVKGGQVETTTPENMSPKDETYIATEDAKISPKADSRMAVSHTEGGPTTTQIYRGAGEIESGGKTQTVEAGASGTAIITSAQGIISQNPLVAPPSVIGPRDQQVLRVDNPSGTPITFEWRGGSTSDVVFQLSAKPLFSSLLTAEQVVRGDRITVDGLPAGSYYWRLRSSGGDDKAYWSPTIRFRIIQVIQHVRVPRNLRLEVEATPIGDGVILQGKTDPGVAVSVNEIEVPVSADGSFSKIELFTDKGNQPVQVRAFDEEGNEKVWRKVFQSAGY